MTSFYDRNHLDRLAWQTAREYRQKHKGTGDYAKEDAKVEFWEIGVNRENTFLRVHLTDGYFINVAIQRFRGFMRPS